MNIYYVCETLLSPTSAEAQYYRASNAAIHSKYMVE